MTASTVSCARVGVAAEIHKLTWMQESSCKLDICTGYFGLVYSDGTGEPAAVCLSTSLRLQTIDVARGPRVRCDCETGPETTEKTRCCKRRRELSASSYTWPDTGWPHEEYWLASLLRNDKSCRYAFLQARPRSARQTGQAEHSAYQMVDDCIIAGGKI